MAPEMGAGALSPGALDGRSLFDYEYVDGDSVQHLLGGVAQ